ncbi:hypothetical protein C461_08819 [Halorubrum aidingense JCM 13560]|uniref:Uncharacterized protein n=1 Tax=Halorubrum aidingense JCM 13560 TaxID=1230454 RepID=M0PCD0_9EURY|nr:hypothetical protein [Halorubrum aidingense]EMA67817.1 hypothetical protein C461_08819 [Halorubrum aidingense JCM 13560]
MPDTKSGRDKQARDAERRRIQRDISEARARGDEPEPEDDTPPECYRRGCTEPAAFSVTERYQEDTGKGAVEATALLCVEHTVAEGPANLDHAYDEYVFRIDPIEGVDVEIEA